MRISHRYKFIFFANPKTASSSVRQFLNPYTDVLPASNYLKRTQENPFYPHIKPSETKLLFQRFDWGFDNYHKFVFVRNPWERLVSLYEHIMRDFTDHLEFDEWLYSIRPNGIGGLGEDHHRWRKYGSYSIEHYIKDDKGNILVDKVIRLEDIQKDLRPFLSSLGLLNIENATLNHSNNAKNPKHYSEYYTERTQAYVREVYAYDILHYNYTFHKSKRSLLGFLKR